MEELSRPCLFRFPRAAVTNHTGLGAAPGHSAGGCKSETKVSAGWFLLEAEEEPVPCF